MNTLFALFDPATDKSLADISLIIGGLLAAVYYGKEIFFGKKKSEVQLSQQPLTVEIVKAMHEQFADKEAFEKLSAENKHEHENLFKKIGGVERGAIERLDRHMGDMQKSAEDGREKIHRRLNRMSIGLANLCGRVGAQMPSEEEET